MVKLMAVTPWRVAVTRDDKADGSVAAMLDAAGFIPLPIPILIEGPAPDPRQLQRVANDLEAFDWIVCASARAVRAISSARGSRWPSQPRTAAVGAITALAMRDAGARDPIVAETFTARALMERLSHSEMWPGKNVLITTVAAGRRDLIDGLRHRGAEVTELQAYTMIGRSHADIRQEWTAAAPDAVILGSAETARHLVAAIGVDALQTLQAIVPIGPTTAAALEDTGLRFTLPEEATFASAVAKLKSLQAT